MAAQFHFYSDAFKNINDLVNDYITSVATNVIASITPVATTCITLYVIMWGWAMMRGSISEPVTDSFDRIIRLCFVTSIALYIGNYNDYVTELLWKSPDAMAAVVVGNGGDANSNIQYLDTQMSRIFDFGDAYYQKAQANSTMGIPDIGLLLIGLLIWGFGLITTGYAAFLLILTKLTLAAFLGIGPLFIFFMIFEATKKLFESWLGQILTATFLTILTAAILRLVMSILEKYLAAAAGAGVSQDPSIASAFPAIILCLISVLVLLQLPSIAASLGGGVAVNTLGAAGWAYNKMRGAATGAKDLASGKTLSDMRGQRRAKAINKQWASRNPGRTSRAASAVASRIAERRQNKVSKARK